MEDALVSGLDALSPPDVHYVNAACGWLDLDNLKEAVAELDLPINVIGVIAACENMPDGAAQKPGDVMRSMSGKTP